MGGIGSHTKPGEGASVEWYTPPEIVSDLGPFDLDPCFKSPRPWDTAREHYSHDGISRPWHGFIWLNPPYGRETGLWLERLGKHGNGIAIVFARTETKMFQKWVWEKATSLRFLYGRPRFYRQDGKQAKGNSGGPVVLVGYGAEAMRRLRRSTVPGKFIGLEAKAKQAEEGR